MCHRFFIGSGKFLPDLDPVERRGTFVNEHFLGIFPNNPDYPTGSGGGGGGSAALPASEIRIITGTPAPSSGYQLATTDRLVLVDTSVARQLLLPVNPGNGFGVTIIDVSGSAGSNPITLTPGTNDSFVGLGNPSTINLNNGRRSLIYYRASGALTGTWQAVVSDVASSINPLSHRRVASSGTTTLLATDELVSVDTVTAAAAVTLKLPLAPAPGTCIVVEDTTGGANTANITVQTQIPDCFGANEPVNTPGTTASAGSEAIVFPYGRRAFYYDASGKWHLLYTSVPTIGARFVAVGSTLTADDFVVFYSNATTGNITTPPIPRPGQILIFKENAGSTANAVTLVGSGSQKINTAATAPAATLGLAQTAYGKQGYAWDGTNWMAIF